MKKLWNLWLKFDAFLITKLESLTQKFQKLTGKDNFWLCKIILIACGILFLAGCLFEKLSVLYIIVYFLMISFCIFELYVTESEVKDYIIAGLSNPAKVKISDIATRLNLALTAPCIIIIAGIWDFGYKEIIFCSAFLLITIFLYVEACDPLPPCKGKIKEFIGSMFFNLKPAVSSTK